MRLRALHARWARLENEHHRLVAAIEQARRRAADVKPMRARQARLLLEINSVVAEIRDAPASSLGDYLALLDVAIEHEIDLAADMAYYGPDDFPLIVRLLQGLAGLSPGFEFNSLRRWLSLPGQIEPFESKAARLEIIDQPHGPRASATDGAEPREPAKVSRDP